jgi:hypothetical protein
MPSGVRFAPVLSISVTPQSVASVMSGVMPWTCAYAGATMTATAPPRVSRRLSLMAIFLISSSLLELARQSSLPLDGSYGKKNGLVFQAKLATHDAARARVLPLVRCEALRREPF